MSDLTRRLHQAGVAVTNEYLAGLQRAAPEPYAARRDAFARTIYEHWNPGLRWEDAHPDDRIAYGSDADAAIKAADAAAGISYAQPLRADVYQELAVRLDYYTETTEAQQAGLTAVGGVVRQWGAQLSAEAQQPEHLDTCIWCPGRPEIPRSRFDEHVSRAHPSVSDPRTHANCWSRGEVTSPDGVIHEIACARGRHWWGRHRNRSMRWPCPPRCCCVRHVRKYRSQPS
ncbi:hypothetical protein [Streptomyces sp. NPDC005732]|uniref:hypothetical protein n=1 Tax=Streptomyces sp. NPDC005732 TaxID=3157057 RepID=UPI0034114B4F